MHHRYHRHGRLFFRRPFPNRQELIDRLESYQRDLEQELADVADVLAHLREEGEAAGGPTPEPQQA